VDDRHRAAVLAYCRETHGPELAEATAVAILASLAARRCPPSDAELLDLARNALAAPPAPAGLGPPWRELITAVRRERGARALAGTLAASPAAPSSADDRQARTGAAARRGFVVLSSSAGASPSATPRPDGPGQAHARRAPAPGWLRRYRVFMSALAVGAVVVVAVALLLGRGSSGSLDSSLPPPSPAAVPAAEVGVAGPVIPPHRRAPSHAARRAVRRRAASPPTTAAVTATRAPAPTPPSTQAAAPPTTSAPVAAAPTAPTSGGAPPGGGSGQAVATQENGSLPAQSAPTQTVSPGG
jgi:hypothetical protein